MCNIRKLLNISLIIILLISAACSPATQVVAPSATPDTNDDEPIVLTIIGDGVAYETNWTLERLISLSDGYRELVYSTTNNWPSFGFMEARGVSLSYLLSQSGIKDTAASIKLISTDGYYVYIPCAQALNPLYFYPHNIASVNDVASEAEAIIAWIWGDVGNVREEEIRPFFGQTGPWEVNTAAFVKNLCTIEVCITSTGNWAIPESSIVDGASITAGTELELSHENMDSVRIYYTLDGSEPDYFSEVYNKSTSYFQPQLVEPLVLTESLTLKAFAAGLGKERSETATFVYSVK